VEYSERSMHLTEVKMLTLVIFEMTIYQSNRYDFATTYSSVCVLIPVRQPLTTVSVTY